MASLIDNIFYRLFGPRSKDWAGFADKPAIPLLRSPSDALWASIERLARRFATGIKQSWLFKKVFSFVGNNSRNSESQENDMHNQTQERVERCLSEEARRGFLQSIQAMFTPTPKKQIKRQARDNREKLLKSYAELGAQVGNIALGKKEWQGKPWENKFASYRASLQVFRAQYKIIAEQQPTVGSEAEAVGWAEHQNKFKRQYIQYRLQLEEIWRRGQYKTLRNELTTTFKHIKKALKDKKYPDTALLQAVKQALNHFYALLSKEHSLFSQVQLDIKKLSGLIFTAVRKILDQEIVHCMGKMEHLNAQQKEDFAYWRDSWYSSLLQPQAGTRIHATAAQVPTRVHVISTALVPSASTIGAQVEIGTHTVSSPEAPSSAMSPEQRLAVELNKLNDWKQAVITQLREKRDASEDAVKGFLEEKIKELQIRYRKATLYFHPDRIKPTDGAQVHPFVLWTAAIEAIAKEWRAVASMGENSQYWVNFAAELFKGIYENHELFEKYCQTVDELGELLVREEAFYQAFPRELSAVRAAICGTKTEVSELRTEVSELGARVNELGARVRVKEQIAQINEANSKVETSTQEVKVALAKIEKSAEVNKKLQQDIAQLSKRLAEWQVREQSITSQARTQRYLSGSPPAKYNPSLLTSIKCVREIDRVAKLSTDSDENFTSTSNPVIEVTAM